MINTNEALELFAKECKRVYLEFHTSKNARMDGDSNDTK